MKKVVIFGAGVLGRILYTRIKDNMDVLFFVDNNYKNTEPIDSVKILSPSALSVYEFDTVVIASADGLDSIYAQLKNDIHVLDSKINRLFSEYYQQIEEYYSRHGEATRVKFLESFALYIMNHNIKGNCAEVGVYKGVFAGNINRCFPDRQLFLFDTFTGFDERDLQNEAQMDINYQILEKAFDGVRFHTDTSIATALETCPYPDRCVIKKGYFPETFDLKNERFVFVNLDTDLYSPIKSGLEIFYPLMSYGGIILIHDYFTHMGVAKAVDEFVLKNRLALIPIGDNLSVAIVKSLEAAITP